VPPDSLAKIYRSFGKSCFLIFYPEAGSNRILETLLDLYQTARRKIPENDITELKYTVDVQKSARFVITTKEP
jgi:hypothetical protein